MLSYKHNLSIELHAILLPRHRFIYYQIYIGARLAQLEEAWTVNHAVGRSSPSWDKLTKSLQQVSNPKHAGYVALRPKHGDLVYYNNIVSTFKIYLGPSHIGHVLRLSGAVSPDVLRFESLPITQTVPKGVGTENRVTSNLPFLLDPSSIAKTQSQSIVTDSRLLQIYLAVSVKW